MSDPTLRDQIINVLAPHGEPAPLVADCGPCERAGKVADAILTALADWHPAAPSEPDVLAEAAPWLSLCSAHNGGLPLGQARLKSCTCPTGDLRAVVERLVEELTASRTTIARAVVARRRQEDELTELTVANGVLHNRVDAQRHELEALRPVVRAAFAWRNSDDVQAVGVDEIGEELVRAVDAFPLPAEP